MNGVAIGALSAPNRVSVMNALPADHRGVGSGMNATIHNSGQVVSIGIFFTLMTVGLSATLPRVLFGGLVGVGVAPAVAHHIATLPAVTVLFASYLDDNPMGHLLGARALSSLSPRAYATVIGHTFFPTIIQHAFVAGVRPALSFATTVCALAAVMSWLCGGRRATKNGSPSDADVPFVASAD